MPSAGKRRPNGASKSVSSPSRCRGARIHALALAAEADQGARGARSFRTRIAESALARMLRAPHSAHTCRRA